MHYCRLKVGLSDFQVADHMQSQSCLKFCWESAAVFDKQDYENPSFDSPKSTVAYPRQAWTPACQDHLSPADFPCSRATASQSSWPNHSSNFRISISQAAQRYKSPVFYSTEKKPGVRMTSLCWGTQVKLYSCFGKINRLADLSYLLGLAKFSLQLRARLSHI